MPKLKSLKFSIFDPFDSKCVDLNKLCPSLKELELFCKHQHDVCEWEEFLPNSNPCPNLNSLSLGQIVLRIQPFQHILNIFPKLTKLVLDVGRDGAEILNKIMTQMTQLEDLSVYGRIEGIESIDALLTGIPVQDVKKLKRWVSSLKDMPVQLRGEVIRLYRNQYSQFPSITNLTRFKTFAIEHYCR